MTCIKCPYIIIPYFLKKSSESRKVRFFMKLKNSDKKVSNPRFYQLRWLLRGIEMVLFTFLFIFHLHTHTCLLNLPLYLYLAELFVSSFKQMRKDNGNSMFLRSFLYTLWDGNVGYILWYTTKHEFMIQMDRRISFMRYINLNKSLPYCFITGFN